MRTRIAILAGVLVTAALFLRGPDRFLSPKFWAEDAAAVFFKDAMRWACRPLCGRMPATRIVRHALLACSFVVFLTRLPDPKLADDDWAAAARCIETQPSCAVTVNPGTTFTIQTPRRSN